MAVLVEALSVVIRRDAINRRFYGGWYQFLESVQNSTLCYDDDLIRVGFMTPTDVEKFIKHLDSEGLEFIDEGKFKDFAVVDQVNGPTMPVEWLEFAKLPIDGKGVKVSACWLFDGLRVAAGMHLHSLSQALATPDGWTYEGSLSADFHFVANEEFEGKLKFLRSEFGNDVYLDLISGKELYVGRVEKQKKRQERNPVSTKDLNEQEVQETNSQIELEVHPTLVVRQPAEVSFIAFDALDRRVQDISSFLVQLGPIPQPNPIWIFGDGKSWGQIIEHTDAIKNHSNAIERVAKLFCDWLYECSELLSEPGWYALARKFELRMTACPEDIFQLLKIIQKKTDAEILKSLRDFME